MRRSRFWRRPPHAASVSLVASIAEHPEQSIPEALGKWGDVKAAYRFFDNEKVTVDAIYDGHLAPTLEKIKDQPVIAIRNF